MEPFPSYGGAVFSATSKKVIRLILHGCANRPFFHISVQEFKNEPDEPVIEQLGNYDPLPNNHNEKLVSINFQRLEYWLRHGAEPTVPVRKLLGLAGYFPVYPLSLMEAFRRRHKLLDEIEKLKIEAAKFVAEDKPAADKQSESTASASEEEPAASSSSTEPGKGGEESSDKDSKS